MRILCSMAIHCQTGDLDCSYLFGYRSHVAAIWRPIQSERCFPWPHPSIRPSIRPSICPSIQSNVIQCNPIQSNPIQSNPIQSNPIQSIHLHILQSFQDQERVGSPTSRNYTHFPRFFPIVLPPPSPHTKPTAHRSLTSILQQGGLARSSGAHHPHQGPFGHLRAASSVFLGSLWDLTPPKGENMGLAPPQKKKKIYIIKKGKHQWVNFVTRPPPPTHPLETPKPKPICCVVPFETALFVVGLKRNTNIY